MNSLRDNEKVNKIEARDAEAEKIKQERKSTRTRVVSGGRDKGVYIKVNTELYDEFTQINKKKAATNNGIFNMLLAEYVRNNRDWLEEN